MADKISIIGTGETFTDLVQWAADIGTNAQGLYVTGDVAIAEVKEDIISSQDICVFGAANVDNPISKAIIRPTSGNAHNGDAAAGITLRQTSIANEIVEMATATDYDVEVEDLILESTSASASVGLYLSINYSQFGSMTLRRLLMLGGGGSATGSWSSTTGRKIHIIRCQYRGLGIAIDRIDGEVSGCGVDGCTTGFAARTNLTIARNNIVLGAGTCYSGTFPASADTNMASDATAPGTTVFNNEVRGDIWNDPDNNDWTLKSGTNAIDTGTNLGSAKQEDIDITNTLVSGDWDLGAYHSAAPAPGIPVSGQRRLHTFGL